MTKTRSQTGNTAIKKEEQDGKTALRLNGISNTRRSSRIAKRTPPTANNRRLPTQQVKVEEDTDIKSLLQSGSKSSKIPKGQRISQEQINQLVHYIVNDNMSVFRASRKVNMCRQSASSYYSLYKNDPKKKVPVPQNRYTHPRKCYTQEQIGNLIRYINDDKMTLTEASVKVNMACRSAYHYYNKYLEDPNHAIPVRQLQQSYTQEQKNELINYIVRGKMSVLAASKKAKMSVGAARYHYHRYFKHQNPDIARPSHIATRKHYTQEQIKELIGYIVDDKMSIAAGSIKANICPMSASKYYRQYLKANNTEIPVPKTKFFTPDRINKVIGYIVDDRMSIRAASKKANMHYHTANKYYHRHLND
jgi:hypothetical protein